jgi:hypothetical protein
MLIGGAMIIFVVYIGCVGAVFTRYPKDPCPTLSNLDRCSRPWDPILVFENFTPI